MPRIMTWNIKTGVGNDPSVPGRPGERDLHRIGDVIREVGPDVVTLQEVDRNRDRTGFEDQAATLAGVLGMDAAYGPNLIDEAGEYGVAVLSKHPIADVHHERFPLQHGWEPRGFVLVSTDLPGIGEVAIATTPLQVAIGEGEEEDARLQRREAASILAARLREQRVPVILTGDFNTSPDAPEQEPLRFLNDVWRIAGNGSGGATFPASPFEEPVVRIDGVLVSREIRVEDVRVFRTRTTALASDHYPIVVEVEAKGAERMCRPGT